MNNSLIETLVRLGISRREDLRPYFPRVRDRDDIAVLRCARSGVIVLERVDQATVAHYANEQYADAITAAGVTHDAAILDDARARALLYRHLVRGKRWLDVGTGPAAVLDAMAPDAHAVAAVEPNDILRRQAAARGYRIFPAISDVPTAEPFDVVTLFHVFEHLPEPQQTLGELRDVLAPGGLVLLEVPHAREIGRAHV